MIHHAMSYVENSPEEVAKGAGKWKNLPFTDVWRVLESLVKKGLVKNIGLSNFNHFQIEEVPLYGP